MAEEIFEKSLELKASQASQLGSLVSVWWKEISKQVQTPASPGKLYAIGNYLVELVKNSLSDGKSDGKVVAIFDGEKVKIVIDDLGNAEREINLNVKGEYGMKEALEYFDVFTVEAKGRKYEKNFRNMLEETDDSDRYGGSQVTLVKYHITPVDEEQQAYQMKRNFGERM